MSCGQFVTLMALSLDIILVGGILKYRYTACIPSYISGSGRCVYACVCLVYKHVLLTQIDPTAGYVDIGVY